MNDATIFKLISTLRHIVEGRLVQREGGHSELVDHDNPLVMLEAALEEFEQGTGDAKVAAIWARDPQEAVTVMAKIGSDRVVTVVADPKPGSPMGAVWVYARVPDLEFVTTRFPFWEQTGSMIIVSP